MRIKSNAGFVVPSLEQLTTPATGGPNTTGQRHGYQAGNFDALLCAFLNSI
jgi:hypothetical protein